MNQAAENPIRLSLAHLTVLDADPLTLIDAAAAGRFDAIGLRIVPPMPTDQIVPVIGNERLIGEIERRLDATGVRVLDIEAVRQRERQILRVVLKTALDGSKDVVVATDVVPLPAAGMGVAFNPNDGLVFVAIPTLQEVDVINPKPGAAALVQRIQGLGKGTYGVAVDTKANRLYLTNRDENTVSVIDISAPDPRAFKEIARLPVGALPEGVAFDPGRGVAYVGNSAGNTMSLIDGGKLNVFATLVVGSTPKAAVVDAVTGRVYVPSQQDNVVRVIQP